ncbi:MAG: DNRLRE domain-containing protein [Planctomycetota bacterium]|nr:DNRLRE domain-containing protein [Planctomycetota bacterium]
MKIRSRTRPAIESARRLAGSARVHSTAPGSMPVCWPPIAALASLAALVPAAADQIELLPVADNTLYQGEPGLVSNGSGQFLFVGNTANFEIRRALVRFDLGAIPPGAAIDEAELRIVATRLSAPPNSIAAHVALAAWGEGASDALEQEGTGAPAAPGDATWTFAFFSTVPWAPGGVFRAAPSAAASVPTTPTVVSLTSPALVDDVRAWVASPTTNFGWMLRGTETRNRTAVQLASRESPDASTRPRLIVTFTPQCPADFNGDGQPDFFDYLDFVGAFNAEDASADLNGDMQVDFFDYLEFAARFDAGC